MARRFVIFTYALSDAEGAAVYARLGLAGGAAARRVPCAARQRRPGRGGQDGASHAERPGRGAPNSFRARCPRARLSDAERAAFASLSRLEAASFEMANLRKAAAARTFSADIDRATAKKLYGGPTSVSVTRLEKYAACPFMHFIQYGLRPEKRRAVRAPIRPTRARSITRRWRISCGTGAFGRHERRGGRRADGRGGRASARAHDGRAAGRQSRHAGAQPAHEDDRSTRGEDGDASSSPRAASSRSRWR